MKQKLIKITDDHYVVVDDSEIKFGDWFLTDDKRIEQSAPDWNAREWHRKITHSTQPLEWFEDDRKQGLLWDKVKAFNLSEVKELIGEVDEIEWEVTFDEQGKIKLI